MRDFARGQHNGELALLTGPLEIADLSEFDSQNAIEEFRLLMALGSRQRGGSFLCRYLLKNALRAKRNTGTVFSFDDYRYSDNELNAWVHRLGDILFQREGPPTLTELKKRYLTAEECASIEGDRSAG